MQGIFQLATATDLRDKLRRDLQHLKSEPVNSDAAFNFIVTAEHMLDWVYPGIDNPKRKSEREDSVLLQVCSHLANGAKHFEVEAPHHRSVSSTELAGGYFSSNYFGGRYFGSSYFGGRRLIIRLEGKAAKDLGQTIGLIELSEKIMEHWDKHPAIK